MNTCIKTFVCITLLTLGIIGMTKAVTSNTPFSLFDGIYSFQEVHKFSATCFQSDTVVLKVGSTESLPGDTICAPITVQNFDSVVSMQFSMRWNPLKFEFKEIQNLNLPGLNSSNFNTTKLEEGFISFVWIATLPQNGESLPDGSMLFETCFEAIGSPEDSTVFSISNEPVFIELTTVNQPSGASVNVMNGALDIIAPHKLYAEYSSCSTPLSTNKGSFTVNVFGGMPPYSVRWERSNNPLINGSDTLDTEGDSAHFSDLNPTQGPAVYDVTVTDDQGNAITFSVDVLDAPPPYVELGLQNPCTDYMEGIIGLDSIQANAPYSLQWSTGVFNVQTIDELSSGTYAVTMTDNYGCKEIDSFSLEIDPLRPDSTFIDHNTCEGTSDGSVGIFPVGGYPDADSTYSFEWSDQTTEQDTSSNLSDLAAGSYSVTVTDEQGCTLSRSFTIDNERRIVIDDLIVDSVSCFGASDGSISFSVNTEGGTEPPGTNYIFLWSPVVSSLNSGDSVWTTPSLSAGNYNVTVYDDPSLEGCRLEQSFQVYSPDSLRFTVTTEPELDSMMNGSIDLDVSGGTPPYDIIWFRDSVQIGPPFPQDSLKAGTYIFQITDANDCTIRDSVQVEGMTTVIERPVSGTDWKISPNPVRNTAELRCVQCSRTVKHWKLIGIDGTIHRENHYDNGQRATWNIPVADLQPGLYLLKWTLSDGTIGTRRIIKN